jgi:hypothetical protein
MRFVKYAVAFMALSAALPAAATSYVDEGSLGPQLNAGNDFETFSVTSADTDTVYYWEGTAQTPGTLNFNLGATKSGSGQDAGFALAASCTSLGCSAPFASSSGTPISSQTIDIPAQSSFTVYTTGAGNPTGTNYTGNVSWGAAPEPAAWAMMLVGVGGIGFAMRRRTALASVAA